MNKRAILALFIVSLMVLSAVVPALAQDDVTEIRILWYNDGNEGEVIRDLLDRFEADNPDISVELDTIAYGDLHNVLQAQVEAGGEEAPDIARITDTARFRPFFLDMTDNLADAGFWTENFAEPVLGSFRSGADDEGIYGFPTQFHRHGVPFINATAFEQAGVDIPADDASWDEWVAAATEVAEVTGIPYAVAIDRSGHRVWGPALSIGATFLNDDGSFTVDSDGFRQTAEMIIGWHSDEVTPAEVWVGSGDQYASATDFYVNGELVMYMTGTWQIQNFGENIGDSFDWRAIPNPTGDGGSTGILGGAVLASMNTTEHPEEVARVMDYLVQTDVLRRIHRPYPVHPRSHWRSKCWRRL